MKFDSNQLTTFIQLTINFAVYLFFTFQAFKSKIKYPVSVICTIVSVYVIISTFLMMLFLMPNSHFPQYRYWVLLLWLSTTIIIAILLFNSHLQQILFLIFVILGIQFNIMQISSIIYEYNYFSRIFPDNSVRILFINVFALILFLPYIHYLFIVLFKKVVDACIEKTYWSKLSVLPITSYLYCVFTSTHYSFSRETSFGVELLIMMLLNFFSFLSYVVVLQMLIKTNESLNASKTVNIIQQQLMIQSAQYRKLVENINQTDRLRHDMRHHFVTLKGLIENRDFTNADIYLDNCLGKELPKVESTICENHPVDMILRYYIAIAQEFDTEVKTSVHIPKDCQIPDTTLSVIFGNLIENAVESCKRQIDSRKFITIMAKFVENGMLAIIVTNSYEGAIVQRGDGFLSKKHSGTGIGTNSVKSLVERTGGNCKFSFQDHVFKVSILLIS